MSSSDICQICFKELSKYSCPRCNRLYCSVLCYKSKNHLECSESFYRDCIAQEMASQECSQITANYPGMSDKMKKMYEILLRMQSVESNTSTISDINLDDIEDPSEGEEILDSDDECSGKDLAVRMKDVDLNDADTVWDRLNEGEKQEFESLVQSGDVTNIIDVYVPWWEQTTEKQLIQELDENNSKLVSAHSVNHPPILDDIKDLETISAKPPAPCVRFNLTNILAAYSFTVRFFNGDHLNYSHESAHCVVSISANLKANWNYESEETAVESITLEAHNEGLAVDENDTTQMKHDVEMIFKGPDDIKNIYVLAALSDLYRIMAFAKNSKKGDKKYNPGVFSKRYGDHVINSFGEVKRSKINVYLKKIEYFLAYTKKLI